MCLKHTKEASVAGTDRTWTAFPEAEVGLREGKDREGSGGEGRGVEGSWGGEGGRAGEDSKQMSDMITLTF